MFRLPSFHSSLPDIGPLCPSSGIEPSADDIHAELVEDEDEEVTLQTVIAMVVVVRGEKTKYSEISFVLSFILLLPKIHFGSHILSFFVDKIGIQ